MNDRPLTETTADDWDDALDRITRSAGPGARELPELTRLLDSDLHHLVLAPATRTIWWAYDGNPDGERDLTVQQLTPAVAAEQLADIIETIQDRQADLIAYTEGTADPDQDQDALDEYTEILLLTLPENPAAAAAAIKDCRRRIARQDALQQRAYARLVGDLAGAERGGKTRAAGILGLTDVQVGRLIREDQERRAALSEKIRAARESL